MMQSGASATQQSPDDGPGPSSVTFASGGLSWTRVRTPRLLSRIAKALYAVGAAGSVLIALELYAFGSFTSLLSAIAWPLLIASYILSLTQTSFPGRLEIVAQALVIHAGGKEQRIERRSVKSALVVDRHVFGTFVPTVEIELENGNVLVARLGDPHAAHAVVRALGFGPGGGRVHVTLAKPTRRLVHPLLGIAMQIMSLMTVFFVGSLIGGSAGRLAEFGFAIYPLVTLALYTLAKRAIRAPEVTIGDDGVLVRGRFRTTFVPRSELAYASAAAGASLVIERRDGRRSVVSGALLDGARLSAVARVIEERTAPSAAGAERLDHYDRNGRSLAEWRDHLSRAMNETSYRTNATTADEAAAVLRSVQATPEQRVGAALALRIAGIPKERIRIAVEATVDDRMREALEAVAEHDDDAPLEKALARLSPP